MKPVRLVHLSDLHFGVPGQDVMWESLKIFLRGLAPELVLVTGDIVDSPDQKLMTHAAKELSEASLVAAAHPGLFVCAGNHDRYRHGNALGRRWKALLARFGARGSAPEWFEKAFTGKIPGFEPGVELTLHHLDALDIRSNQWKVRLISMDSSEAAAYLANGFIPPDKFEALKQCVDAKSIGDADLFIALLHHHLLPVPTLDTAIHSLGPLVVRGATVMANAGSALAALSGVHVDIVLHGHDHHRHMARYGSLRDDRSDLIVLGAASSTGAVTGKPCVPEGASFNMLELRSDRTVWACEYHWRDGGWRSAENETRLLSNKNLRRSSFLRRTEKDKRYTSDVSKHVVFTRNRDAIVRERRTDLQIDNGTWNLIVRNSTGEPATPKVSFQADRSVTPKRTSGGFVKWNCEDHAYIYEVELEDCAPLRVSRMDIEYQWLDAVLLDVGDLELFDTGKLGVFRRKGMEFIASSVDKHLRSLTLSVSFPDGFSPDETAVGVWTQNVDGKDDEPQRSLSLSSGLHCNGDGVFTVGIPYPKRGYRYFLAWTLPDRIRPSPSYEPIADLARRAGNQLAVAFCNAFLDSDWKMLVTVAVYLAQPANGAKTIALNAVAMHCHDAQNGTLSLIPQTIDLRQQRGLYLHSWWGDEGICISEGESAPDDTARAEGLVAGEKMLATVPLRVGEYAPCSPPLGIVRVGVKWDASKRDAFASPETVAFLRKRIAEGKIRMLHTLYA